MRPCVCMCIAHACMCIAHACMCILHVHSMQKSNSFLFIQNSTQKCSLTCSNLSSSVIYQKLSAVGMIFCLWRCAIVHGQGQIAGCSDSPFYRPQTKEHRHASISNHIQHKHKREHRFFNRLLILLSMLHDDRPPSINSRGVSGFRHGCRNGGRKEAVMRPCVCMCIAISCWAMAFLIPGVNTSTMGEA